MSHVFDVFGVFTCLGFFVSKKYGMCLTCLACLRVWDFSLPTMSHVFDVFDVFRLLLDQLVAVFDVFDVFRRFPKKRSHVFDVFGVFTCLRIFSPKNKPCVWCVETSS